MENKSYSYGVKITGVILHFFFTIILTLSLFLLGALISKNIFEFSDIGTRNFLNSGYYTQTIQEKCDHLGEYMYLRGKGDERTAEENRKYLQYTDEFKAEDTNFCFWYKLKDLWITNQPDTYEGQSFDPELLMMQARTMGNYLLYDMENKEFGTDIKKLATYFFESTNTQMYWPTDDVILIIGVDTQFSAMDDLYYASEEYHQMYPWIKTAITAALMSLIGWILTLIYLTLAAGRRVGDAEIHLTAFDKIKTEILFVGFIAIAAELVYIIVRVSDQEWELSGLLAAAGTVSFVMDVLFLVFYLSIVKLMKAECLWKNSLVYWVKNGILKVMNNQKATTNMLIIFMCHLVIGFVLALGTFRYKNRLSMLLLLMFCGIEGYLLLRQALEKYYIMEGVKRIKEGALDTKIDLEELRGENRILAEDINNIGAGLEFAVEESTKNERMKADLITNVSHDIKTPLTSIVNYVNLLKREDIENERALGYIRILDEKAERLKQLTEDLVEASKVSSGNVKLDMQTIDLVELVYQTAGEFDEKFERKRLTIVTKLPNVPVYIWADGRQLYRVIENLYNNVAKYAMESTRVYVEIMVKEERVIFSIKNVSEKSLAQENSQAGDLTERFTRGDSSRTTEGSGLGLSIAKNLTCLMGGTFNISVDGDLFRATLIFLNQSSIEKVIDIGKI
ncbi:MAG: HAMP domain-containing histidine kinase [Roseburia sp.]|nr:HAMP domain-containing histidine kinase [Roseburia sp.]